MIKRRNLHHLVLQHLANTRVVVVLVVHIAHNGESLSSKHWYSQEKFLVLGLYFQDALAAVAVNGLLLWYALDEIGRLFVERMQQNIIVVMFGTSQIFAVLTQTCLRL
ncbi:hypothetical protein [Piscirickettsia salmonis]|uniref:hypothetical protein n=1 Tax=Piscirickettsia salmonis TaxID=1238 RepID=UPI003A7F7B3D